MDEKHIVIVGGGLAGLATGCYARASGYATTIVEHNLALGGVCTAWKRGPYLVDGCIHWLTGGAFARLYEELGVVPRVPLRTLEQWMTWRDAREQKEIVVTRDLRRLATDLKRIGAPHDAAEIDRVVAAADHIANLDPHVERAPEIASAREQLRSLWEMRGAFGEVAHFHAPIAAWAQRFESVSLQRFFTSIVPPEAPALMLPMFLGYLARGWLSRPQGGTRAFRDAIVDRYTRSGGRAILHATVDEILVENGRACGVRLDDGRIVRADAVVSTSSTPETALRLLGGRFDDAPVRERMRDWKMFRPIVLASFGVTMPLERMPAMLIVDRMEPFDVGGVSNDHLYLRICNDDPAFAPPGDAVVQAMLSTDYEWWATRGDAYESAKDDVADVARAQIARVIPGFGESVRMIDVATPLTYWQKTRSWRGAYEGWTPNQSSLFGHVKKKMSGLEGFYMAGQWVEPGGGVPTALMSGRQVVQILCDDDRRAFQA
jgi:phytoene dehydrogenase-like protein